MSINLKRMDNHGRNYTIVPTLEWFDLISEEYIGNEELKECAIKILNDVLVLEKSDPLIGALKLHKNELESIVGLISHDIDEKKYKYYLSFDNIVWDT